VSRRGWLGLSQILVVGLCALGFALSGSAQGLRSVITSQDKVFPAVGAGVTAIKRDSAGRYYILAKPESVISVYGADGNLVDRFPNAKSKGATIRYAVDIDVSPSGNLVVADRGSNTLDVFAPDGSLLDRIPVVAPTSVVALSDNQFAVSSLTSKHLVQVVDQRGRIVRTFGDPIEVASSSNDSDDMNAKPKETMNDFGRISGDSTGAIYFAFTSIPNPTVRKYDRYGYLGYEASIPEGVFGEGANRPADRVQFSFGFSDMSFSSQSSAFLTVGSSHDLQFGGGVGTGFGEALRRGAGYGQAVQQQTMGGGGAGGPMGATFSGDVTGQGSNFQLGMGPVSRFGGGGRGRGGAGNFGSVSGQARGNNSAALQFNTTGNPLDSSDVDLSASDVDPSSLNASTQNGPFDSNIFGPPPPGAYNGTPQGGGLGQEGLPGAFVFGSTSDFFFRHPGARDAFGGAGPSTGVPGTGAPAAAGAGAAGGAAGAGGAHAAGSSARGPNSFSNGYHRGFGRNSFGFTGSVRVNLGDLGRVSAFDKPIITAMAADPQTHEIWAGIGDTLVHFSKDGDPEGIYYLTLSGGTPLKPVAVLVEADRILIAADPWGVFEFPRPDKPNSLPAKLNVVPQVVPQSQPHL